MIKDRYNMVRIKVREYMNQYLASRRCERLTNKDFTIVSNNCWAGHVYRYFGLPYATPTIGLYFWAEDYLTLMSDVKGFFQEELFFIEPEESKHSSILIERDEKRVPIGCLEHDGKRIEIVFLHYHSREEAKQKWQRRVLRVNYDNMIFKYCYQNGCTEDMVMQFEKMDAMKKFMFVNKKNMQGAHCVYYKGWENKNEVGNDTNNFIRYIDIYALINDGIVKDKHTFI